MRVRSTAGVAAISLAIVLGTRGAMAQPPSAPIVMRATVDPGVARLGEPLTYRGRVAYASGRLNAKWLPPEPDPDITWGTPRARRVPGARSATRVPPNAMDTLSVDIPLQVFRTGTVMIPGLRFQDQVPNAAIMRLPAVTLVIAPVLTAADSNADLKPARGPLPAPWYERVPWMWVLIGLLAIVAIVLLVRWVKHRRRAPVAVAPPRLLDPAAQALAELAELRAQLPARGQFDAHAFQLTRILRRYLEAVTHVPRPGHTTPELVAALASSRLGPDDLQRLGALLRVWDRLKFARASSSVDEAGRSEAAVEALVTQLRAAAPEKAA